jgi:[ribosomal protein S5]-alanine N-acetyltransferase
VVTTEQLELRPLPVAAARALFDDPKTAGRLIGAVVPSDWPLPDLKDVVDRHQPPFGIWVLVERETDTVVGDIGFHGPPDESGTVEIGYSVLPERRRRGYATEAVRALTSWALEQPGVRAVTASCEPTNIGSIRALERAGFTRVGENADLVHWRYPAS